MKWNFQIKLGGKLDRRSNNELWNSGNELRVKELTRRPKKQLRGHETS